MKQETEKWLRKAEEDLDSAKFSFNGIRYDLAMFLCQQAAEKAMKAVMLEREGEIIKVHDLVILAKKVNAPEDMLQNAKELTLAYTYTRYPDLPKINDIKGKSEEFLDYAKKVIKWAKESLQG